jgi:glutathionylspermidine synthase
MKMIDLNLDEGQVRRIITLMKRSAQNPDNSWRAYDEELVGILEFSYRNDFDTSVFEYNADSRADCIYCN